jgi:Domain of unknown function (DUF5916)/Carbohydrate family 9 binding domain-like
MKPMSPLAIVCALSLAGSLMPTPARADDPPAPRAVRTTSVAALRLDPQARAIQVDGELTDEAWLKAPVVTGFLQRVPSEGAPATHETEVRIAFDSTALYVAVNAIDAQPDRIVGILTRRDDQSPSDWVSIYVDSFLDRRSAYEFGVNAAGVKYDRYWFNDSNNDGGWDAVWDVAVTKHAGGWRAEFKIPFSQLRFRPSESSTFGFAAARTIARLNETSTWPLIARSASGYVSSFGELTGLDVSGRQKKFEVMPYALTQMTTAPVRPGDPLRESPDPDGTLGLDLKYAVAPGLTFTGTINPDFGQVEADPSVVNLSGFETFFAERRPFFVEGSGTFRFDVDCNDGSCTGLFYSRRVGRAPQRFVNAPEGGFADQPTNSTILGAGKLTGRIGKYSIGALHAVTGREYARIASGPSLEISETPVEPLSNYSVFRVNREFDNRSRIGVMATGLRRSLTDDLRFLPSSAVSGGVDADIRIGQRYSINGFFAGSSVHGSKDAIARLQRSTVHSYQRPDAEHVDYDPARTSLRGHAGQLSFNKIGGLRTRFNAYVSYKSPGFDINDVGFMQRADDLGHGFWFQVRENTPGKYVRDMSVNFNFWQGWNLDGDRRYWGGNVNGHLLFTNNWQFSTGLNYNGQGFADRLTRGGPGGYTNANVNQWGYFQTDNRKPVFGSLNFSWLKDRHGAWQGDLSPSITFRPSSALSISAGLGFNRNHAQSQWITNLVSTEGPRYIFGRLDQTTMRLTARVNYTITPTLSLQVYAQPFQSAGDYSGFKELSNGRSKAYEGRYRPFDYRDNPDFNVRSFRTTNVLRWEYRPGSALFVVWQQGRDHFVPMGEFEFSRGFSDLFNAPSTNTFLIKFSRWMNF